jgi:hypothetical protein
MQILRINEATPLRSRTGRERIELQEMVERGGERSVVGADSVAQALAAPQAAGGHVQPQCKQAAKVSVQGVARQAWVRRLYRAA